MREKMIRSCCPARRAHRVPQVHPAKNSLRGIPLASEAAIRARDSSAHFAVVDATEAAIVAATIAAAIVVVTVEETAVVIAAVAIIAADVPADASSAVDPVVADNIAVTAAIKVAALARLADRN